MCLVSFPKQVRECALAEFWSRVVDGGFFFGGGGGGSSLTRVHLCIQTRRTSIFLINSWPITCTISPKTNFLSNVLWVSMAPLHQRSRKLYSKLKKKKLSYTCLQMLRTQVCYKVGHCFWSKCLQQSFIAPWGLAKTTLFFFWKVSFSQKKKKRSRQTSSFAIIRFSPFFSSVAVQREQRKNQKQGNIYKDLSVRSCAESVCAQCACVKCSCDF